MVKVIFGLVAAATLVGCSSTSSGSKAPLRDASSVRASAATVGALGQPIKMGDLTITVSNPVVGGDDAGGWLTVTVKVENLGSQKNEGFNPGIVCAGDASGSGAAQVSSTLNPGLGFPARSVDTGTLNLLTAGETRTGQPAKPCATPAAIEFVPLVIYQGVPAPVRIPLADDLIAALNAKH